MAQFPSEGSSSNNERIEGLKEESETKEDVKREIEDTSFEEYVPLDEAAIKAKARREKDRLRKAKQRAADRERGTAKEMGNNRRSLLPSYSTFKHSLNMARLPLECASEELVRVRKALIAQVEGCPGLWDRTLLQFTDRAARTHDWRRIMERLQVTFEKDPELKAKCDSTDKIRHQWHRISGHHNCLWRKNGWKDSGT